VGAFVHDRAVNVHPGQLLALATSGDTSAHFQPSAIQSVEWVMAAGKFLPGVASPYIWVDGVVMPL
jgi:hypothetical protein